MCGDKPVFMSRAQFRRNYCMCVTSSCDFDTVIINGANEACNKCKKVQCNYRSSWCDAVCGLRVRTLRFTDVRLTLT